MESPIMHWDSRDAITLDILIYTVTPWDVTTALGLDSNPKIARKQEDNQWGTHNTMYKGMVTKNGIKVDMEMTSIRGQMLENRAIHKSG